MTLEEAIEIAQNQDATAHKVGNIRPEFKGEPLQMEVHKLQGNRQSRASRKRQQPQRPASNDQKQGRSKRETCFYCGAKPSHPKSECPAKREKCFKCGKEGHYVSVCKSKSKDARVNELHVQSTTASECVDCVLNEYEPVSKAIMTVQWKTLVPALRTLTMVTRYSEFCAKSQTAKVI